MTKRNKQILTGILIITVLLSIGMYRRYHFEQLMSTDTTETYGIFDEFVDEAKSCDRSYFNYYVKGKKYEFHECGQFEELTKGDTVLIKYSNIDNSEAQLINTKYRR